MTSTPVRHPELVATVGVVASCAAAAGLLALVTPSTERPGRAAVARAAAPAVAGVIVAVAMDRNRLSTSIQVLPGVFGDPFGGGWDLLGRAGARLDPAPLGTTGLLGAPLAVLLAGAVVLARRIPRRARTRIAAVLSVLAGVSVIAVASH